MTDVANANLSAVHTPENTIAVSTTKARLVIGVLIGNNLFHLVDTFLAFMTKRCSPGTLAHTSTNTRHNNT